MPGRDYNHFEKLFSIELILFVSYANIVHKFVPNYFNYLKNAFAYTQYSRTYCISLIINQESR